MGLALHDAAVNYMVCVDNPSSIKTMAHSIEKS